MATEAGAAVRPAGRVGASPLVPLALLWLAGFDLRCALLAVPPLLPSIHRDLGLDERTVGVLFGLPTFMFAALAIPGALLVARVGARRALMTGLAVVAIAGALRGAGAGVAVLLVMTSLVGAGVAVSQPALPALCKNWLPARVALAIAVYSNGMLIGETLAAALTGPLVLPLVHGSWQLGLAFWSIPVAATVALIALLSGERPAPDNEPLPSWWPDFGDRLMVQLGLVMACASAAYYGANAFIPDFLAATGRPQYRDAALAAVNACQLPASFLMLLAAPALVVRRWPFVGAAALVSVGAVALALAPGGWVVPCAGVIGFATALAMILTLSLPPLLVRPGDVARYSAGIFVIQYGLTFVGPVAGGAAWDATRRPGAAFVALSAAGVAMLIASALLPLRRTRA